MLGYVNQASWCQIHLSLPDKMVSQALGFDIACKWVDRWILLHLVKGQMFYKTLHLVRETMVKTSQELRMLSSFTLNCQVTKIVKKSSSQLSEM